MKKYLLIGLLLFAAPHVSFAAFKHTSTTTYSSSTRSGVLLSSDMTVAVWSYMDRNQSTAFSINQTVAGNSAIRFFGRGAGPGLVNACVINQLTTNSLVNSALQQPTNVWKFNACVFKAGSTLKIYVISTDGTLYDSGSAAIADTGLLSASNITVGINGDLSQGFIGGSRDFMIFDSALSQQQLQNIAMLSNPCATATGGSMVDCWPLADNTDTRDLLSPNEAITNNSNNSTISFADPPGQNIRL